MEGRGIGDTLITGSHIGGDTHITSDVCTGIHTSWAYTYHCDIGIQTMALLRRNKKQTAVINIRKYKLISGKKKGFILTFRMFEHTSSEVVNR